MEIKRPKSSSISTFLLHFCIIISFHSISCPKDNFRNVSYVTDHEFAQSAREFLRKLDKYYLIFILKVIKIISKQKNNILKLRVQFQVERLHFFYFTVIIPSQSINCL
jgi:hypothetical protein